MNQRHFTPDEWWKVVTPLLGETATEHARRVAKALGVGCVTTSKRDDEITRGPTANTPA